MCSTCRVLHKITQASQAIVENLPRRSAPCGMWIHVLGALVFLERRL